MSGIPPPSGRSLPQAHRGNGALYVQGIRHLDRIEYLIGALAIASVVCLVASIVLLCLAQAEYITPFASLYAFGGTIGIFFIIKAVECCIQKPVANHFHVSLPDYYARNKGKNNDNSESDSDSDDETP